MITATFIKSLWLFLLLLFWLRQLQDVKAKWTMFTLSVLIFGVLVFIAQWIIFSLPQPLTNLYPNQESDFSGQPQVLSYNDSRVVVEKDSSDSNFKLKFISLHDGKLLSEYKLKESFCQVVGTSTRICHGNTEVFLNYLSPYSLLAIRGNKVLACELVDTARYAHSELQYDETEKKFVFVSNYYSGGLHENFPKAIHLMTFDENFEQKNDKVFYVNTNKLDQDAAKLGEIFYIDRVLYSNYSLYGFHDYNNAIVRFRKQENSDSLVLDQLFPDSTAAHEKIQVLFDRWGYKRFGNNTDKGFLPWHIMPDWLRDSTGELIYNIWNTKCKDGMMISDYGGRIKMNDSIEANEIVMGKYAVSYVGYGNKGYRMYAYEGPPDSNDPGLGWIINVRDTAQKTKMKFMLHDWQYGSIQFFLSGDTLVAFADDMKTMARFDLTRGIRLDEQPYTTRLLARVYYYRTAHNLFYNFLLLFSYFFLPLYLLLQLIARIFKQKKIFSWFNLQRACTLYFIIALITLIQMSERIWQ